MTTAVSKVKVNERWSLAKCENREEAIAFAVEHWISAAHVATKTRGHFSVALSGGSTPKAIYKRLSAPECAKRVDWTKVLAFWSDERAVPPDHEESNYRMAMQAGLAKLPIPEENIFRMQAESDMEVHAAAYEHLIKEKTEGVFDLMMLGMGPDGHTASLFPGTKGLEETKALVVANYLPDKESYRMTCTFPCINQAKQICLYVLGEDKEPALRSALLGPQGQVPVQRVGTERHPALWITDVQLPC